MENLWRKLVDGSTMRTWVMLSVLAVLAWGYAISHMAGAAAEAQDERDRLANLLARVSAQAEAADWDSRLQLASAAQAQARERLWEGGSPGVLAARVQSYLDASARRLGFENVRINVTDSGQMEGGAALLQGRMNAVDPGGLLPQLLAQLSQAEPALVLTGFEYSRQAGGLRLDFHALALSEPLPAAPGSQALGGGDLHHEDYFGDGPPPPGFGDPSDVANRMAPRAGMIREGETP